MTNFRYNQAGSTTGYIVPQIGETEVSLSNPLPVVLVSGPPPVAPETFGAVSGTVSPAQRLTNLAAINTAILASQGVNGNVVQFGPFTYQIDGTIVVPPAASNITPLLQGVRGITRIEQWHAAGGIDTIRFGPPVGNPGGLTAYGGGIVGLWIVSMIDQSTISPSAGNLGAQLAIVGGFFNRFADLIIGEYNQRIVDTTHFAYNGICFDTTGGTFSSNFQNIHVKGYGQCGINAQASSSGNYWANIMIVNGGLGEPSLKTSNAPALIIGNGEGVWDQINIEWSIFGSQNPAINLTSSAGVKFGHLHLEGIQLSAGFGGARSGFISVPGASISRFDSIHMISTNLPTGCNIGSAGIFQFGFSASYSNVSVGQMLVAQTLALGVGVNFYLVNTGEGSGAGTATNCSVDFAGPWLPFGDGTFSSKLTNWSDCNFAATNRGPANGLGVPPSNFKGEGVLTVLTTTPGYSAGTFTPNLNDGNGTYIWGAAVNGTISMLQTQLDATLPVTLPPFPGTRRTIVNIQGGANTVAVHNADTTNILSAATLSAGQWTEIEFTGAAWKQVKAGTLL